MKSIFPLLVLTLCVILPSLGIKDDRITANDLPCECSSCECSMLSNAIKLASSEKPKLLRLQTPQAIVQAAEDLQEEAEVYDDPDEDAELSEEELDFLHHVSQEARDLSKEERKLLFDSLFENGGGSDLSEQDRKRIFNGKFFRKIGGKHQGKLWKFLRDYFDKHDSKNENTKDYQLSMIQSPRALGPFGRTNRDLQLARAETVSVRGKHRLMKDSSESGGKISQEE